MSDRQRAAGTHQQTLPFGIFSGVGVMAMVTACLVALGPDSTAAWLVPLLGIPATLVITALVPGRDSWRFRVGLALGAVLALLVLVGWLIVFFPWA